MTIHKIESGLAATSTIAADPTPTRPTALTRQLLILAILGAGVAWLSGPTGRMLVVLPLLLFGPGLLLERALLPSVHLPGFARPTLWLGLSLSTIALTYEWATQLGIALTPLILALLAAGCGLAVIWQLWRSPRHSVTPSPRHPVTPVMALLAILALTSWTRISEIRDLALPSWVDSVHHALMIRVAAERGQAPLSLRPYLPVDQLPYHWGYHVLVAAAMRLSSLDLPQAMLVTGQVLNVLHGLAVAGLAAYLWRRPLAGIAAALVVGLLSIFPAYYVSWGRYTQLTGLLLLPPLMIIWLELLKASPHPSKNQDRVPSGRTENRFVAAGSRFLVLSSRPELRLAIILALLLAGLSLIHFIVLIFALCFMGVSGIAWALGAHRVLVRSRLAWAAGSAVLALALAGPWLWLLAGRALLRSGAGQSLALLGQGDFYKLDPALLWAGNNRMLIALALAAALWGIWRRERAVAALLAWLAGLCVLANPWLALYVLPALGAALLAWSLARRHWAWALGAGTLLLFNPLLIGNVPFIAIISIETVVISLFLPIGVLLGGGAVWVWDYGLQRSKNREPGTENQLSQIGSRFAQRAPVLGSRLVGAAVLVGLALWGARDLRDVVNPATVLATPADVAAIAWVAEHTPPDARFLINAAPWLSTGRGADGGWWLLPLAGRWTSTPPALYDYGPADYVRETRARTQQVLHFAPGQEQALYRLIDRDQITYIYLGPNPAQITAAVFPASQGFEQVYAQGGVTIFAVHRDKVTR
jgi:hypothetical protein